MKRRVEQLAGGIAGRIALLAGAILVIWLGAAAIGTLLGVYPNFNEAFWDTIWHMIDPGALGDDNNTKQRIFGVLLAVCGLVILAGVALTLFQELVERALGHFGAADPPLSIEGHLLVIGSGPALQAIAQRMDDGDASGGSGSLVVLVETGDPAARQSLQRALADEAGAAVRVVGGELHEDGLQRVCAARAAAIVVLAPEVDDADTADLAVLGIGARLATTIPDGQRPPVTMQINRGQNADLVWDQFDLREGFEAIIEDRLTAAAFFESITGGSRLLLAGWSDAAEVLLRELAHDLDLEAITIIHSERPLGLPKRIGDLPVDFVAGRPNDADDISPVLEQIRPDRIVIATTPSGDARAALTALQFERLARGGAFPELQDTVIITQQSSADHANRLRFGVERVTVISAPELTAKLVSRSAT